ncbi:MAG: hypothetical protein WD428_00535 [Gaiellaceae bacterium]
MAPAAEQLETTIDAEFERVLRWRFQELARAGYEAEAAATIAARGDIDLHRATELLRQGCPADVALQILL